MLPLPCLEDSLECLLPDNVERSSSSYGYGYGEVIGSGRRTVRRIIVWDFRLCHQGRRSTIIALLEPAVLFFLKVGFSSSISSTECEILLRWDLVKDIVDFFHTGCLEHSRTAGGRMCQRRFDLLVHGSDLNVLSLSSPCFVPQAGASPVDGTCLNL